MATSPQPPRPPMPPQPPRSGSTIVLIVVLFLALIVVVAGLGIWTAAHIITRNVHVQVAQGDGGKKEVSIQTPIGSLAVHREVNEASLGLPIYPGATRVKDKDSATVSIDIADQAKVRVLAAKFETPDSYEKVRAFYRAQLGDQVTRYREKDAEGKTVFEIKHDKQEKVVALKSKGDVTEIELVRVSEGHGEGN
jgi:hypothetical protein